jgi:hypothetical protein
MRQSRPKEVGKIDGDGPHWASRAVLARSQHLCLQQQRSRREVPSAARGEHGYHALQQRHVSFDHLVRPREQRGRHVQTKPYGGLQVDH